MTIKTIVKDIMAKRGFTNKALADALGYATPSGVSERLRGNMRVDVLLKMLDAMNCELVVKSKLTDKGQWVVTDEDPVKYDLDALLSE